MGTDIEKLVDLMIQERMQGQFAKWREAETGKEKKADYLRLETEYEKAISALSEEQKEAVRHYCDSIFDSGAESECFFYRLGLKDGCLLYTSSVFLQIYLVHPAPPPDGAAFFRQLQVWYVVVPDQNIVQTVAVIMDTCF